ncbi:MAG: S-adenosylmethionine:tRNA ribosyltransferase-isomerase, partial [Pseudomonadota bacterium]
MHLNDFNYTYPKELIAQEPLERRDASRMMVVERRSQTLSHNKISDIVEFLREGDLLIFNDSKVIPARLIGKRMSGGRISILLLNEIDRSGLWCAIATRTKRIKIGEKIEFAEGFYATVVDKKSDNIILQFDCDDITSKLDKHGIPPLPPYILRGDDLNLEDKER